MVAGSFGRASCSSCPRSTCLRRQIRASDAGLGFCILAKEAGRTSTTNATDEGGGVQPTRVAFLEPYLQGAHQEDNWYAADPSLPHDSGDSHAIPGKAQRREQRCRKKKTPLSEILKLGRWSLKQRQRDHFEEFARRLPGPLECRAASSRWRASRRRLPDATLCMGDAVFALAVVTLSCMAAGRRDQHRNTSRA